MYYDDPQIRAKGQGFEGSAFSLSGGHIVREWKFGRSAISFINSPTEAILDGTSNDANAKYFLTITKDPDGNFTQVISDIQGSTLKTRSDAGSTSSGISEAVNYVDYTGNVYQAQRMGEINSSDPASSFYQMTAGGQVLSTDLPDEGMSQMVYDRSGNLRFVKTEKDMQPPINGKRFLAHKYDRFGRNWETGVISWTDGMDYFWSAFSGAYNFPEEHPDPNYGYNYKYLPKIRNYYDFSNTLASELATPSFIVNVLKNLRGRLAATVAFDESGNTVSSNNRVEEYFSYDADGRLEAKYKIIPGLAVQRFAFTYDLQGKVKTKIYQTLNYSGASTYSDTWNYLYDARGRLSSIQAAGSTLVSYDYDAIGHLIGKHFKKGAAAIGDETYSYNIRDWLLSHRASVPGAGIYKEDLTYEVPGTGTPRYGGNISSATHNYLMAAYAVSQFYKYDGAGQLVATTGTAGYNENYSYDTKGRIIQKTEGTKSYGPYNYSAGTHQVVSVPNSPMNSVLGNYTYDPNGNMVLDRSKKMAIQYDWRNLPIAFKIYHTLPNRPIAWNEVDALPFTDGIQETAEVKMMYDADGNRVFKKNFQF